METFRVEAIQAPKAHLDNEDSDVLEDIDLTSADLPLDIRTYLSEGGSGSSMLTVHNIDSYLDAGAATRSSSGGYFQDAQRESVSRNRTCRTNLLIFQVLRRQRWSLRWTDA